MVSLNKSTVLTCDVLFAAVLLLTLALEITTCRCTDRLTEPELHEEGHGSNSSPYIHTPLSQICKIPPAPNHWRKEQIGTFESPRYEWRKMGVQASACAPTNDIDKEAGLLNIICLFCIRYI